MVVATIPVGDAPIGVAVAPDARSEEHTSELQSRSDLVCRLLLEKKKKHCRTDRKSTRLNSRHEQKTYAVLGYEKKTYYCLKSQVAYLISIITDTSSTSDDLTMT